MDTKADERVDCDAGRIKVAEGLSRSAQKIQDALALLGAGAEVVELPSSTRTSADAASAIGCAIDQIAKTIIFRTTADHKPIMVIASGKNRINEKSIKEIIGEPVEKADASFVRDVTGYVIGGVPPVGHSDKFTTIVDEELFAQEVIWAAAGTPHAVFKLTPGLLVQITHGLVKSII